MKWVSFFAAALLAGMTAQAQGPGGPAGPPGRFGMHGFGPGRMMGMHPGKVVTGAPFSANFTDTSSQSLPGNNSVNRTTTGTIARDSQGRTYFTETISKGPLAQSGPTTLTFLFDPVAGYSYVLNSQAKTAMRRAIRPHNGGPAAPDAPSPASTPKTRPPGVTETALTTPPVNWNVNVTGKQITHTIPAGEIGNTAPIVSTSVVWYATDLQTVVYSTHTDPRFGTSTYALSNINTAEPAASLFQIPAGYAVEDAPARSPGHGPNGAPAPPE